jgi:hypothetical protein
MATRSRTIVGGRAGARDGSGGYPRGIEVLLKKAKVDAEFREQFLKEPLAVAAGLELDLLESEKKLLASATASTLRLLVNRTFVPKHHVPTFMSRNVPAMVALVLASTLVFGVDGVEAQSKGITGEELLVRPTEVAVQRMAFIQRALEAYAKDHGRYPSTEQWITIPNPLREYVGSGSLFDPWNRKFHYQAVTKDGRIVGYCLQSWGASYADARDDLVCPPGPGGEHRFPRDRPLALRLPRWEGGADVLIQAKHEDGSQAVEWYLDDQRLGRTVGPHQLVVPRALLAGGEHVLLVTDDGGHYAMLGLRDPAASLPATGGEKPRL